MTDKMEPVAWMRRWKHDGVEGTKANRPRGWKLKGVTDVKALDDDVPLYTADQVKELTDRLKTRIINAEAALAEARKVIEPFVTAFENRRHIYSKRYKDRDLGYANFDKMPDNWPMDGIKFSMGKFRSLSRWLQADKGDV
jgi:hypothetical protein